MSGDFTDLERARRELQLPMADLWVRYFALGGMSAALDLEAILFGAITTTDHNRDVIAVALNECFAERRLPDRLPFANDPPIDL